MGLNSVLRTGVNMLGDVHRGAGERCAGLLIDIAGRIDAGSARGDAIADAMAA